MLTLVTAPTLEILTLAQIKEHLRLDSGSPAEDLTTYQSILPGSHAIHELMTLDVAPGGAGWAVGDTITGQTSARTCVITTVLTTTTYYVRSRSGAFTLGEILSNGVDTADQGAANPTFATGYYLLGTGVDVLGKTAIVNLNAGTVGAGGTVDAKIQESDDNTTYTDWSGGAFTLVNAANDNAIQEKAYTGTRRYIRVVSRVLGAACEFGADVLVYAATTAEDDLLTALIATARGDVETFTSRKLLTQVWDYSLSGWPSKNHIRIPFGNLQNGVGTAPVITWKDDDGTVTTLTVTTDYLVETNGQECGRIVLPYGETWPSGTLYPSNPINIRFYCGWTAAASIPAQILTAAKFRVENMHQHGGRNDVLTRVFESLLWDYRLPWEF